MLQMQRRSSQLNTQLMEMCRESLKKVTFAGIRTLTPGLIFFKGPFWGAYIGRGLSTKGNLLFQIDWASLVVGRKFTVFALFYFVFEGNFQVQAPPRGGGAYIWRGDLMDRLATSGPLGERSKPYLAAKRPNASGEVRHMKSDEGLFWKSI